MTSPHAQYLSIGASPSVIAAYDILVDHGYSPEKAAEWAVNAGRAGKDPEEFARHLIRLRAALNTP
jgi:hypothetical protein